MICRATHALFGGPKNVHVVPKQGRLQGHPWGRLGAAAFVRLGGTVANLTAWAQW